MGWRGPFYAGGLPASRWWLGVTALLLWATPQVALAHWCDCLWDTAYNLVVRPASDTVNAPGELDIWVQNNMGYPLENFALTGSASGYSISVSRDVPKVNNYLMPGEKLRHTLTVSGSGTLDVGAITFSVTFGANAQPSRYDPDVVIKRPGGGLAPSNLSSTLPDDTFNQARHLRSSARADFGDLDSAIDDLLDEFCAGRASWSDAQPIPSWCPSDGSTSCQGSPSGTPNKYHYQHLWAASELAFRKTAAAFSTAEKQTFSERLQCAAQDPAPQFQALVLFVLGYLGDFGGSVTYLEGLVAAGGTTATYARAALLLANGSYHTEVSNQISAGTSCGNNDVADMVSAAALGIYDGPAADTLVEQELIECARWIEPDTSDNGNALFAAHLLNVVAWDRRGWATQAGDEENPSFFETDVDDVPPQTPANFQCQVTGTIENPILRLTWSQVTQDVNGGNESVAHYRVEWGGSSRDPSCTDSTNPCNPYVHSGETTSIYYEPGGLTPGATYFFSVLAIDTSTNRSSFSQEVTCDAPIAQHPPNAVITCAPLTGTAPPTVDVTCDCNSSSDPDNDLQDCIFYLDGGNEQQQSQVSYSFDQPGGHTVTLVVVDAQGLSDTDSATIAIDDPAGNSAPVAIAEASPTEGPAPLTVSFDGSNSYDPDAGDTISFLWDFADNGATSTDVQPNHTFNNPGTYSVVLDVTDDAASPLTGHGSIQINVVTPTNEPPDLSLASVAPLFLPPGGTVTFDATGVDDPEGDRFQVTWHFGDGTPNAIQDPVWNDGQQKWRINEVATHAYPDLGSFTATLDVDDDGTPLASDSRDFSIVVTTNRAPDVTAATVTPQTGPAPLRVVLDASLCTDPDGDQLTIEWAVSSVWGGTESLSGPVVEHDLNEPEVYTITLTLTDDASPPRQSTRTFTVTVLEDSPTHGPLINDCGCPKGSIGFVFWGAPGLLGWGWRLRRRRPGPAPASPRE